LNWKAKNVSQKENKQKYQTKGWVYEELLKYFFYIRK